MYIKWNYNNININDNKSENAHGKKWAKRWKVRVRWIHETNYVWALTRSLVRSAAIVLIWPNGNILTSDTDFVFASIYWHICCCSSGFVAAFVSIIRTLPIEMCCAVGH